MRVTRKPIHGEHPATPREFVEVWQGSASVAEVAAKLGRRRSAVRLRARRYRERGIPLKDLPPAEPTDWGALARYAAELAGEEE
jgi:hypothetical protein